MGDRANIIVKQGNNDAPVVLYSHWGATTLIDGLMDEAIAKAQERAGDPHYFTALLTAVLVDSQVLSGVGTSLDDTSGPIFVIDAITGKRSAQVSEKEALVIIKGEV